MPKFIYNFALYFILHAFGLKKKNPFKITIMLDDMVSNSAHTPYNLWTENDLKKKGGSCGKC